MIAGVTPAAWAALIASCEAAWPREACGWLGGAADAADELRPATTGGPTAFAFADDDLIALATASRRGPTPRLLYHSHPAGPARLSPADRAALAPDGVVLHPLPHLVIAVRAGRAEAATLYRWHGATPVVAAAVQRAGGDRWTAADGAR